mgnify:FL=1
MSLSHQELRTLVLYNKKTGIFTSLVGRRGLSKGKIMGHHNKTLGYVEIGVKRKSYLAHRLAWFYVYGVWPKEIDHRNNDRSDNRLLNLREVNSSENKWNAKRRIDNRSGYKGIYRHQNGWRARVSAKGLTHEIGVFLNIEDAYKARCMAVKKLHGEFARTA